MQRAISIDILAQVPRKKAALGTRACMGLTAKSLEAEEKTMRRFVFEMSVIASSKVNGWAGKMKTCRTKKGWTRAKVCLSEPGIWSLVL